MSGSGLSVVKMSKLTFPHTVGSHSDDRGGASDALCHCEDDPPQETGIDGLLLTFGAKYNTASMTGDVHWKEEARKEAKAALLQLLEKEAEIVEFPYERDGEYERPAIPLSKLRELLGGDI